MKPVESEKYRNRYCDGVGLTSEIIHGATHVILTGS